MRVWQTSAIQVELVDVPAGVRLRGHGHGEPHACFVVAGAFDEREGRTRHRLAAAGTLRGSPAGDEHDLTFRAPSRCLLVLFSGGAIEPPTPSERRWIIDARAQRRADELGRLIGERGTSPLEVELLALELMASATGALPSARADMRLERVRQRIADAPACPPTTRELALESGVHPVYLARAFRTAYGMGIGEYARLRRAEHARRLLEQATLPLATLALTAGYADQSHMTRELRRFLGATPVAVRGGAARVRQVAGVQDDAGLAVSSWS